MNRKLKFRIWDKKSNKFWHKTNGITEFGIVITSNGVPGLVSDITDSKNPNKKCYYFSTEFLIIQQFTGLTDKTGREIYEGDIVLLPKVGKYSKTIDSEFIQIKAIIEYENGSFCFVSDDWKSTLHFCVQMKWNKDTKVIGNIFENSKLL